MRSRILILGALQLLGVAHAATPTLQLEQIDSNWLVRIAGSENAAVEVTVDSHDKTLPPLLGTIESKGAERIFRPRFPFQPGLAYRATVASTPPVVLKFSIPAAATATSATNITAVYPSTDTVPENQLKFYIHFSDAMARGDAYRWIRLLDERGNAIDAPFLELGEELWDADNQRLTLYFDPGRVKSDLLPGREMGAPLRAGRSYTLELDKRWPDAQNRPLGTAYRKSFRVVAADRVLPAPKLWRVLAPIAGTTDALTIELPEPLDHALLLRMIEVRDGDQPIAGSVAVDNKETRWRFTPTAAWRPGTYSLNANSALEDLAGNKLNRPFEFEGARTPEERVSPAAVVIPFNISTR